MADKEKDKKNEDGKKRGNCLSSCLGCFFIVVILSVLLILFGIMPLYDKYKNDINSNNFVKKVRTYLGDKVDSWNYKYVRGFKDTTEDFQEEAIDSYNEVKGEVIDTKEEFFENGEEFADDANDFFDEPLIDR